MTTMLLEPTPGPPRRRSGPAVVVTAVLILAMLATGIVAAVQRAGEGESSSGKAATTPLQTVQASSTRTLEAHTARASISLKSDSGVFARGFREDGAIDFANNRGSFNIDVSSIGVPGSGQKIEAVYDFATSGGAVVYVHIPALSRQLGGKGWMKVDVQQLLQRAGAKVDFNQLLQSRSNDPTSGLRLLRGADSVMEVGHEQVRGADTTHYTAVVSVDKAIGAAPPEAQESLRQLASLSSEQSHTIDVWLDSAGRVRRIRQGIDLSKVRLPAGTANPPANALGGHLIITYEMYGFGAPVDVHIPAPSETVDIFDVLSRAG